MFVITNERGYTKIVAQAILKHSDYIYNLIPSINKITSGSQFRIMVVLNDVQSIEIKALLKDLNIYVSHKNKANKIAIVTKKRFLLLYMSILRYIVKGKFKMFNNENLAEIWLIKGVYYD